MQHQVAIRCRLFTFSRLRYERLRSYELDICRCIGDGDIGIMSSVLMSRRLDVRR